MRHRRPFYSKNEKHYHNNPKCGPGSEIPARNRVYDSNAGKPLCDDCKKLNDEEDAIKPTSK